MSDFLPELNLIFTRHVVEACLASTDFTVAWGTQRFNENQINLSYLFRLRFKKNSTPQFLGTYLQHSFKYTYIHWRVLTCDTPATYTYPESFLHMRTHEGQTYPEPTGPPKNQLMDFL